LEEIITFWTKCLSKTFLINLITIAFEAQNFFKSQSS
jgi:hypothetical protein